jgi:hypothetical protein
MSLITTIAEFKSYISIDANTKMATLQPFINEAEQLYIIPLLGQDFYDEYLAWYTAWYAAQQVTTTAGPTTTVPPTTTVAPTTTEGSPTTDELNAALLPYIQRPLCYYAQLLSIDQLAVNFGDKGTRIHMDENSMAAPRWAQEKLQFQALKSADTHADKLLKYMEDNASETVYATWFGSSANTKKSGVMVYSTEIASRFIQINESRRVYLKLYNTIKEIEARFAKKLVGAEQYDALVTALASGDVDEAQQALLDKLYPIICKRALYMQLPFMRVQINENGIFVYSGLDELYKYFATDADIKLLRQQLIDGELGYLADEEALKEFITDNIADYPLIEASAAYTKVPDPGPTFKPNNSPDNKHFIA